MNAYREWRGDDPDGERRLDDVPFMPSNDDMPPIPAPRKLAIVDAASLAGRSIPERLWHVGGIIPIGTVTLLGGDGATGKSLLAEMLAASTAIGATWLGYEVRQGPVLFLSAEDDMDEIHRRLDAILAETGTQFDEVSGLSLVSLAGEDAVLGAFDGRSNAVKPSPLFAALDAHMAATKPSLVILDTLSDLFAGDENQRTQARQFIGLLRGLAMRHACAVVLLAHPSLSGMASGSGTSGSTAWNNSVRSRLYFERVKEDDGSEPDPDMRVLRLLKANYAQRGTEIRVRWRCGVFVNEDQVGSSFSAMTAQERADGVFLDLLDAYTAEGRRVSHGTSKNYAPLVFAQDKRSGGLRKRALADAMNRLFAAKVIRVVTYGPPSKSYSRIERA